MKALRKQMLFRALNFLPRADRKKIWLIAVIQVGLSIIDLVAVASVGLIGALAIRGIESRQPGNRVGQILKFLGMSGLSFDTQIMVFGIFAGIIFTARTVISIYFSKRILYYMSLKSARISASLIRELLNKPYLSLKKVSNQELLFAVTYGVSTVLVQILGTGILLVSDFSLLFIMSLGLLVLDPFMALLTFSFFGAIGWLLHFLSSKKVSTLSKNSVQLGIETNEKILQVLNAYREIYVRDRRSFFSERIGNLRLKAAETDAELNFMPNIGKYIIEAAGILGALLLGGIEFYRADASHAIATLSVFIAAGSRITPAALRVQQSVLKIKTNEGAGDKTLKLINDFELQIDYTDSKNVSSSQIDTTHDGFVPSISLNRVRFQYTSDDGSFSVGEFNLNILPGEFVAIVGPSGAGKTTLVDLILGVITPDHGEVTISGLQPSRAVNQYPGAIAYVPQDVAIFSGSLSDNIALGYESENIDKREIQRAIEITKLTDLRENQSDASLIEIGESGGFVSGGQRQRIGIARALLTHPKLILLDEATSSLDGQTESSISESIQGLRGQVTSIVVAHRLSTVKSADKVIYMCAGKIEFIGTFEEVRRNVRDFDDQAKLMGL